MLKQRKRSQPGKDLSKSFMCNIKVPEYFFICPAIFKKAGLIRKRIKTSKWPSAWFVVPDDICQSWHGSAFWSYHQWGVAEWTRVKHESRNQPITFQDPTNMQLNVHIPPQWAASVVWICPHRWAPQGPLWCPSRFQTPDFYKRLAERKKEVH